MRWWRRRWRRSATPTCEGGWVHRAWQTNAPVAPGTWLPLHDLRAATSAPSSAVAEARRRPPRALAQAVVGRASVVGGLSARARPRGALLRACAAPWERRSLRVAGPRCRRGTRGCRGSEARACPKYATGGESAAGCCGYYTVALAEAIVVMCAAVASAIERRHGRGLLYASHGNARGCVVGCAAFHSLKARLAELPCTVTGSLSMLVCGT